MALMARMHAELGGEFNQEEWEIQHFVATFLLPAVDKELSQQDGIFLSPVTISCFSKSILQLIYF
jgi:hypothetical protein